MTNRTEELDYTDELEKMMADEAKEIRANVEALGVDFSGCVDLTSDISFSEAKDDTPAKADVVITPRSMIEEEVLIERTDICERIGLSAFGIHDAQMAGEDIRVNLYGICDANQNVSLELVVDGGKDFYESALVPLNDNEKASLKNAMEKACQDLTQTSLAEFITKDETLQEKTAEKPKKNNKEFDDR